MSKVTMLRNVPFFAGLSDPELEVLAESLGSAPLARG